MPPPLGCAEDTQSGLLASAGCVCVCVWECRALWAAVGVKVEALPHTCKFQCGSSSWHGAPVSLLSAVQHWPVLYRTALHSPHAVVVLACTALHCSAIFRRQGVVGRYVQYVCRRKHRHTCPHKHPHTHIAAPIRQLDVHPGISYMDRQVPSMRHTPIATGLCPQHMHLYSNRPPALHRWTGGHPGQPVGEATYAA